MSTNSEHSKMLRLLEEGEACLAKLEKTVEHRKLKKGIRYYARFRARLPINFIKTHGLTSEDFVYVIPQRPLNEKGEKKHAIEVKSTGSIKVRLKLYKRIIKGKEYWYIYGKLPAGVDITKLPKEQLVEWSY